MPTTVHTSPPATAAVLLLAPPVLAMDLSYAPSSVKAALEQRDEAMAYQCTGGMFDCEWTLEDGLRVLGFIAAYTRLHGVSFGNEKHASLPIMLQG